MRTVEIRLEENTIADGAFQAAQGHPAAWDFARYDTVRIYGHHGEL